MHEAQSVKLKVKVKQFETVISQLQGDLFQKTETQKRKMNESQANKYEEILK